MAILDNGIIVAGLWHIFVPKPKFVRPRPTGGLQQNPDYYDDKNVGAARTLSSTQKTQIRKRFGNRCVWYPCLSNQGIMHVDHIKPRNDGGEDNLDNLQLMCEVCNTKHKRHFWTFQAKQLVNAEDKTATIGGVPLNYDKEEDEFMQYWHQHGTLKEPLPWYLVLPDGSPYLLKDFSFAGKTDLQAYKAFLSALDKNFNHQFNNWMELQQQYNPIFKKEVSTKK